MTAARRFCTSNQTTSGGSTFSLGRRPTPRWSSARARAAAPAADAGPRRFRLEWMSVYTFQCRRLERFVHGRVVFAGDSAHQVSPFGARGANSGIQDAENLAWKLALVIKGDAPPSLLDSYDVERGAAADENIGHSTRSTDFIAPRSRAGAALPRRRPARWRGTRSSASASSIRAGSRRLRIYETPALDAGRRCLGLAPARRAPPCPTRPCAIRPGGRSGSSTRSAARRRSIAVADGRPPPAPPPGVRRVRSAPTFTMRTSLFARRFDASPGAAYPDPPGPAPRRPLAPPRPGRHRRRLPPPARLSGRRTAMTALLHDSRLDDPDSPTVP